jgi:hypothetical protein
MTRSRRNRAAWPTRGPGFSPRASMICWPSRASSPTERGGLDARAARTRLRSASMRSSRSPPPSAFAWAAARSRRGPTAVRPQAAMALRSEASSGTCEAAKPWCRQREVRNSWVLRGKRRRSATGSASDGASSQRRPARRSSSSGVRASRRASRRPSVSFEDAREQPGGAEEPHPETRVGSDEEFAELLAHTFHGDLAEGVDLQGDGGEGVALDAQVQHRGEPDRAEAAQAVFGEAPARISDAAEQARLEISLASERIHEFEPRRVEGHGVDREVAPGQIFHDVL